MGVRWGSRTVGPPWEIRWLGRLGVPLAPLFLSPAPLAGDRFVLGHRFVSAIVRERAAGAYLVPLDVPRVAAWPPAPESAAAAGPRCPRGGSDCAAGRRRLEVSSDAFAPFGR